MTEIILSAAAATMPIRRGYSPTRCNTAVMTSAEIRKSDAWSLANAALADSIKRR